MPDKAQTNNTTTNDSSTAAATNQQDSANAAIKTKITNSFNEQAESFLYDLDAVNNSQFYLDYFRVGDKDLPNASYRVQAINISPISLKYNSVDSSRRYPSISNVSVPTEFSIKWVEDQYGTVAKFHNWWLTYWFSKLKGAFVVGHEKKLGEMVFVEYVLEKNGDSINPKITNKYFCNTIMPISSAGVSKSMDSSGNTIVEYKYQYGDFQVEISEGIEILNYDGNKWESVKLTAQENEKAKIYL